MSFNEFQEVWQAGHIPAQYSYAVEGDHWAWEAAVSDVNVLQELADSMA
jgi:hypothetical protein